MRKITDYVIVISQNPSENERRAAAFIRDNVRLVCGKLLPIVTDTESAVDNEIVVGETNRELLDGLNFKRFPSALTGNGVVRKIFHFDCQFYRLHTSPLNTTYVF